MMSSTHDKSASKDMPNPEGDNKDEKKDAGPGMAGGGGAPSTNGGEQKTKDKGKSNMPDANDPFAEFLWMENLEQYDEEIMRQLEEDLLISHYSELYEDSLLEDGTAGPTTASLCVRGGGEAHPSGDLDSMTRQFNRSMNLNSSVSSRLNPNAKEFVPSYLKQ